MLFTSPRKYIRLPRLHDQSWMDKQTPTSENRWRTEDITGNYDAQVDKAGKEDAQVTKLRMMTLYVDKTEIRIYWWHKSTNSDEFQDKNKTKTKSINNDELKDKKKKKNVESL